MIRPFKGGTKIVLQDVDVHLPPVGYVYNPTNRELEKSEIITRSARKEDQFWERTQLPKDFRKKWIIQQKRRENDSDYYDPEIADFVNQEWERRLKGVWFMNNGTPTYITGLQYFYLQWWYIGNRDNEGYPDYWDSDRHFFYFMQACIEDNNSAGMLYVTKRREGKTAKSAVFGYEFVSRTKKGRCGIQSKTDEDAQKVVYWDGVISGFKELPEFFRPLYDTSAGSTPKGGLYFRRSAKKGKQSLMELLEEELDSEVTYKSREPKAYDGERLDRYIGDEIFKVKDFNPSDRHDIVYPTLLDKNENIVGKALYTSTVEEIEGNIENYIEFWEQSNPLERNANGRTGTGLYRYFLPAYLTRNRDRYGFVDEEANKRYYLAERQRFANNPAKLTDFKRRFPFTIEEAFWTSNKKCLFDLTKINEQLERIGLGDNLTTKGNFEWNDPDERDYVVFKPRKNGKFNVTWLFDQEHEANKVERRGDLYYPLNKHRFVIGVDPINHKYVEDDGRKSMPAFYVYKKTDALDPDFSDSFIVEYVHRPSNPEVFFEDVFKCCVYYGCQMLFENQKEAIYTHFERTGGKPLVIFPKNRKSPGLPSGEGVHQQIAEYTNIYIDKHIHKVKFRHLLNDWAKFDINNTKKFDATMAAGFSLIAEQKDRAKFKQKQETPPLSNFLKPTAFKL
jgi:hypothetical protein